MLILAKVYHGNVIYKRKACFSSGCTSKQYQSVAMKAMKDGWPHQFISCPSPAIPSMPVHEIYKALRPRKRTVCHMPAHGSQHPYPRTSVGAVLQQDMLSPLHRQAFFMPLSVQTWVVCMHAFDSLASTVPK